MASRSENKVERLIREAQEQGKFSNLKNEGQPIKIEEENPYADPDWRLAYKIVKDSGFVPAWIDMDKDVEAEFIKAQRTRDDHRRWLLRRLDDIKNGPTHSFMSDLRNLRQTHLRFLETHRRTLQEINRKIDTFNSNCPVNQLLKSKLQIDDLLRDFDRSCPAIPEV